jgi:predicted SprT family Zn-dependent metalloprotease
MSTITSCLELLTRDNLLTQEEITGLVLSHKSILDKVRKSEAEKLVCNADTKIIKALEELSPQWKQFISAKIKDSHCDIVEKFMIDKLKEHNLPDWSFSWDKAVRRIGGCHHRHKKITLSRKLIEINNLIECQNTILHEIAHAIAGYEAGHGPLWKEVCIKIGARPERCYDAKVIVEVASKYTEYCEKCDYTRSLHRYKLSIKKYACLSCCKKHNNGKFSEEYLLKIKQNF